MKNSTRQQTYLFPFFLICFMLTSFSLSTLRAQGLTENYASFDIGLGLSSFSYNGDNTSFSFTENSVRNLEIAVDEDIDKKNFTSLLLGVKFGKYKGLSHSLYFNVPLQGSGKGKFGYSLGYNMAIEGGYFDILIRPSLGIATGESSFEVKTIAIDTLGIVVDDTDFIDTDMKVAISQTAHFLIPKLELNFLYAQKSSVWVAVAYDYRLGSNDQSVTFMGDTESEDKTIGIDDPYLNFQLDGQTPSSNVFDPAGINITFGISAYFNRE